MPIITRLATDDVDLFPKAVSALHKLQTDDTDWKARLLIFVLTLLAFAGAGWLILRSSILLPIIVLVVLIHESGHYAAMRCFGYRNLRMFFIPFFGAAVSGQKCAPVRKEAAVCLLGPIPGILLGYLCFGVFLLTRAVFWREFALMLVTINAFNLLPVYPLDGGRFLFALLPRKAHLVQLGVQLLAVIGLMVVAFRSHNHFMSFFSGIATGSMWHLGCLIWMVGEFLRRRPVIDGACVDEIPADIARDLIMTALDGNMSTNPKSIAQTAWEIWTSVKAERPRPREIALLVAVYAGIWLSLWFARSHICGHDLRPPLTPARRTPQANRSPVGVLKSPGIHPRAEKRSACRIPAQPAGLMTGKHWLDWTPGHGRAPWKGENSWRKRKA